MAHNDVLKAGLIAAGFIVAIGLVVGVSPSLQNPFSGKTLYTVKPQPCLEQTPLRFGFTDTTVAADRQTGFTLASITGEENTLSSFGADNATLKAELVGTTSSGQRYRPPALTTTFGVTDVQFSAGTDICFRQEPVAGGVEKKFGLWRNVPSGDYRVKMTIIGDDGKVKATAEKQIALEAGN